MNSEKTNMIALILGGGAGSRLYPLTEKRSKPAVPIGGKYRLVDIPISNCLNSNVRRMFILTQYNSASLNQHIKNTYTFDNFSHGFVDILAAEQTPENENWFGGTADAVRQSMTHLQNNDYDHLLILSGDQLYQMDYQQMLAGHLQENADISIATIPVVAEDATGFGIMKVQANGLIDQFIEKPSTQEVTNWKSAVSSENQQAGKEYLASMGIYIFKKEAILKLFDEQLTANDFGKEIIPAAISGGFRVASYQYEGYWTDIGTIASFMKASMDLLEEIPRFNLFDNMDKIYTRARELPPAKTFKTLLDHTLIGDGAIIHNTSIERSIIGIRSRVEDGTTIKSSILMGNDYYESLHEIAALQQSGLPLMGIGKNCHIENAIIDLNCRVGDNSVIKGGAGMEDIETETYCIREGYVILKKNATIPPGSLIGVSENRNNEVL